MKVDRFSTHVVARFSAYCFDLEIEAQPCDGDPIAPHPKGPKTISMCQASASTHREMGSGG